MKNFLAVFIFMFVISNCGAEEGVLVKDKAGRTYYHELIDSIHGGKNQGHSDKLANAKKLKEGMSLPSFVSVLGAPNEVAINGNLKVYYYKAAFRDLSYPSDEEREGPKNQYEPGAEYYDVVWLTFFFSNNKFIGCGKKIADEVNKEYGVNYAAITCKARFNDGCLALPSEFYELCGMKDSNK